jgi:hypothetical protein
MKWLSIGAASLAALVALIVAIGARLPREHTASRMLRVRRTPVEIWRALEQATAKSSVPVDIVEQDPPRRLVTRVKATEKMFGGTWTCVIAPGTDGSSLTISEDGWVANPFFRFVSRYVIGHHATMDSVLKDVAAQLNQPAALSGQ